MSKIKKALNKSVLFRVAPHSGLEPGTWALTENQARQISTQMNDLQAKIIDVSYFVQLTPNYKLQLSAALA